MKCALCLLDFVNADNNEHVIWSRVSAAETVFDGMAVCLMHFIERLEARP